MDRVTSVLARRFYLRAIVWSIALCGPLLAGANGFADEGPLPTGDPTAASSIRSGGLLEQSFNYRRQPTAQTDSAYAGGARAGGWYGYGFPVQSYRWGWFGAERNYPRVIWHDGYYGDCVRTAYRYGN
jgi:hypothetical protein